VRDGKLIREASARAVPLSGIGPFDTGPSQAPSGRRTEPGEAAMQESRNLPTLVQLRGLASDLAAAAQAVYDEWEQDEEGHDAVLAEGGICDLIASAMVGVLDRAFPDMFATTVHHTIGENHVNVLLCAREGVCSLDVPPSVYETGGGYRWRKKPGVRFGAEDIDLHVIDRDPGRIGLYVEDGDEPSFASGHTGP
jgi:hypothetical protein